MPLKSIKYKSPPLHINRIIYDTEKWTYIYSPLLFLFCCETSTLPPCWFNKVPRRFIFGNIFVRPVPVAAGSCCRQEKSAPRPRAPHKWWFVQWWRGRTAVLYHGVCVRVPVSHCSDLTCESGRCSLSLSSSAVI